MSWERYGGLRAAIAQLAAQLMYGQEVKQYFTAKRLAAKRILGQASAKTVRYSPRDLPSNGEIKQALLELVQEIEGEGRTRRLFAMRVVALEALEALEPFSPRLMGSVATGHVRSGSDVDLHVFAEHPADVEAHVRGLGWVYDVERVDIMKQGKAMSFTHIHVADVFPLELTVYPPSELRNRPRSSTDGKPIVRLRAQTLRALCEREHPELWAQYLSDGTTPTMEEILAAEDADDESSEGEQGLAWTELDDDDLPPEVLAAMFSCADSDAEFDDEAAEPIDGDEPQEEEREPRFRRSNGKPRSKRVLADQG
jgi:hypothetical protein